MFEHEGSPHTYRGTRYGLFAVGPGVRSRHVPLGGPRRVASGEVRSHFG